MCSVNTNEHVFNISDVGKWECKCGLFRFDSPPQNNIFGKETIGATYQPACIILANDGKDFIFIPPLSYV